MNSNPHNIQQAVERLSWRDYKKRNNAVVLQSANRDFLCLLDITWQHHSEYAQAHHMDYWCLRSALQASRHPIWDKIILIKMALALGQHEYIIWLDSDTLIVQPDVDLRDALPPEKWLGMVTHKASLVAPEHQNAGVLYIRNTVEANTFFNRVWDEWPVDHHWHDQEAIRRVLKKDRWSEGLAILSDRWNSTPNVNPADDAVVMAWHGWSDMRTRYGDMSAVLYEVRQERRMQEIR